MEERLQQWPEMLQAAAAGKGGSSPAEKKRITGNISSEYPAWTYRRSSRIREIAVRCYRELYGKEPEVITIHAGLECGILTNKKADLDCISIGPQMYDIHSVKERLGLASTQRTWEYLLSILKACKQ